MPLPPPTKIKNVKTLRIIQRSIVGRKKRTQDEKGLTWIREETSDTDREEGITDGAQVITRRKKQQNMDR